MIKANKVINSVSLLEDKPVYLYWNVMPFMLAYMCLSSLLWLTNVTQWKILILFAIFAIFHAILLLLSFWNLKIRSTLQYNKVSRDSLTNFLNHDTSRNLFIFVEPKLHRGESEICALVRYKTSTAGTVTCYFQYQKRKYSFNIESNLFEKTTYPTKETIDFYKKNRSCGIQTTQELKKLHHEYGRNSFDIPIPTFLDLFKEHALAPFFVFQVFCVGLWCLDEYWYYSLMTLVMLFMFESTVVMSRRRNLTQVRQMSSKPSEIFVYRLNKWIKIMSDDLVPNDVISIVKQSEEDVCPCDMLLLDGKCVTNEALLTGESTPQMKEGISERSGEDSQVRLEIKKSDKRHVIFGGTRILQHQASQNTKTPDGGALALVIRTGFETSQGKLIRTILFSSTGRVTASDKESYLFILFLLVFAIIASGYVLYKGIMEGKKSTYQLILNCTLILTSVVPPELPMELSLAVNNSLLSLSQLSIFCTEPFRIPFAGKVDVCCFDKTGTLTSDKMVLTGIVKVSNSTSSSSSNVNSCNHRVLKQKDEYQEIPEAVNVLAGCHSLISIDNQIIGDPMEKASIIGIDYNLAQSNTDVVEVHPNNNRSFNIKILKRFAFDSVLKRMTTIACVNNKTYYILMKGAPEIIKQFFVPSSLPGEYDAIVNEHTRKGGRVIALGYRKLEYKDKRQVLQNFQQRSDTELDIIFAGFAIFDSEMKPKTNETIRHLVQSSHRVIMITGDNPLTAIHVSRELGITTKENVLILTTAKSTLPSANASNTQEGKDLCWLKSDNSSIPFEEETALDICKENDICVTGDALVELSKLQWYREVGIQFIQIYSRVSPDDKQYVVTKLKERGHCTLMCGDGTNDVGALKQAHIGVALLDDKTQEKLHKIKRKPKNFSEMLKEYQERQKLEEQANLVRLGDASIAASFTSKKSTIESCSDVIRQGRCTLVTTMQMYKILALNCLISAYSLSVLYLDGVKYGDTQMMLAGVVTAICFLFVSRSKPLDKLSKERPLSTVFNAYTMLSILGQFSVHITTLVLCVSGSKLVSPTENLWNVLGDDDITPPPAGDETSFTFPVSNFKPNVFNTIVFITTSLQTVLIFAFNYKGHPFMESLTENKPLFGALCALGGACFLTATNLLPSLNQTLELVEIPSTNNFNALFAGLLLFDVLGVFVFETILKFIFTKKIKH